MRGEPKTRRCTEHAGRAALLSHGTGPLPGLGQGDTLSKGATQVSKNCSRLEPLWTDSTHRPSQVRDVYGAHWLPVTTQVQPPQVCPLRERKATLAPSPDVHLL